MKESLMDHSSMNLGVNPPVEEVPTSHSWTWDCLQKQELTDEVVLA